MLYFYDNLKFQFRTEILHMMYRTPGNTNSQIFSTIFLTKTHILYAIINSIFFLICLLSKSL